MLLVVPVTSALIDVLGPLKSAECERLLAPVEWLTHTTSP